MPSKQVSDREKAARAVAAAAVAHADEIAQAATSALGKLLVKGEKLPDVATLARLAGRLVGARMTALAAADEAHEAELGDDKAPRDARDAAAEKVRGTLVDLRAAVEGAYGAEGLARIGLSSKVPEDPSVLSLLGERVKTALRSTKKLAAPRAGLHVDLETFAKELDASVAALASAVGDVAREAREAHTTLTAKQGAMSNYDEAFARAAGLLEALAELGGLSDLAASVRPSGRRPGRTASGDAGDGNPPAPPAT